MSLTFSIEGIQEEKGYELPCRGCGMTIMQAIGQHECAVCSGYGGAADEDMPKVRYELNVANLNGYALLNFLDLPLDASGAVKGIDLVLRLAIVKHSRYELCRPAQRSGNVFTGGLERPQVDNYFRVLTRIARQAMRYRRNVIWS
jgi:hypothetical protein